MTKDDDTSVSSATRREILSNEGGPLTFTDFPVWLLSAYTHLDASLNRPLKRACISVIHGLALYAIGLLIAVCTHLVSVYVTSGPVYLITISFTFYMGRARWLGLEIVERANKLQEVFLVSPETYFGTMRKIGLRATAVWATMSISAVIVAIGWALVAAGYLAPTSWLGSHIRALEPPTFPQAWYASSNSVGKMLIIGWFLTIAILFATPVFYGTISIVASLPAAARNWAVVPIPAYVTAKSRLITSYFNIGALTYAIAVLSLVLLYGASTNPQFIFIVSLFVIVGLSCVLFPPFVMQRLVERAREQLAKWVADTYRDSVYPVGAGETAVGPIPHGGPNGDFKVAAAKEILRFEEMLQAANQTTGFASQILALAPSTLSQSIPYLGIAISALLKQPHS